MDYQNLSDEQFKRRFVVYKQTYRKMVESVKSVEAESISFMQVSNYTCP